MKSEVRNLKLEISSKPSNAKWFDLGERALRFAKELLRLQQKVTELVSILGVTARNLS